MEDTLYAIPAWANCKIMYYRTDLFEDVTEQQKFKTEYGYDLRVPETWQEYRVSQNSLPRYRWRWKD